MRVRSANTWVGLVNTQLRVMASLVLVVAGLAFVGIGKVSAQTSASCSVSASNGGPWGDQYNQSLTVRNTGGVVLNGARVTVSFPSGHSYVQGWNPSLSATTASPMLLDVAGVIAVGGSLTNSGFNVAVAAGAAVDTRPTYSCVATSPSTPTSTSSILTPGSSTPSTVVPSVPPTVTTTPGGECVVSAVTGGPWSSLYNESLSVNNLSSSALPGVQVTVRFPTGHSYDSGWNPALPATTASSVMLSIPGSFGLGTSLLGSGFNVKLGAGADASLRPSFSCSPLTATSPTTPVPTLTPTTVLPPPTVTPTTAVPSGGCVVNASTGGPWGDTYNQSLSIRNTSGALITGAIVTVSFPTGHTYDGGWNPSLPATLARTVTLNVAGAVGVGGILTNSGFNVAIGQGGDLNQRPSYGCVPQGATTTTDPRTTSTPTSGHAA